MAVYLLVAAVVIIACVVCNKISSKLGIPMLLAFILLGVFFGSDGVVKIPFDNYAFAEQICSVALIFIMFYGGFGTNWKEARPVAGKAILLSSLGTVMTAGLVGLFCWYALHISPLESFLIGAVISSTDAASVFSILRSKRLNLRYHTASLLEIESGSNDPFSYMLTVVVLSLMNGGVSGGQFVYLLTRQLVFGIAFGFGTAALTLLFLKRFRGASAGFSAIFVVAVAIISYAAPTILGGNGYLSAYITGIILGNQRLDNKLELVHFFDGATALMQMLLFFLLGLLSFPSELPKVALTALLIALFLTFVARPLAVFALLAPFGSKFRQQVLVAWAGMRGAASIVFAIMVVIDPVTTDNDVFHIIFFIVLFSILLQGSLIPLVAKKIGMTDDESDVMKTFNDYMEEVPVQFVQFTVRAPHPWVGMALRDMVLPPESLVILITRGGKNIVPNGETVLQENDTLILSGKSTHHTDELKLYERKLEQGDEWIGKTIAQVPSGTTLIILLRRGERVVIPKGDTVLQEQDTLVITDPQSP